MLYWFFHANFWIECQEFSMSDISNSSVVKLLILPKALILYPSTKCYKIFFQLMWKGHILHSRSFYQPYSISIVSVRHNSIYVRHDLMFHFFFRELFGQPGIVFQIILQHYVEILVIHTCWTKLSCNNGFLGETHYSRSCWIAGVRDWEVRTERWQQICKI